MNNFAVTALHCVPTTKQSLGQEIFVRDSIGIRYLCEVYATNAQSDYLVLKLKIGDFRHVPVCKRPYLICNYVAVGLAFGERNLSYRFGRVKSFSNSFEGHFYGDSGGLPGFSGGGVFRSNPIELIGIDLGNLYENTKTETYGDVLSMVSVEIIIQNIRMMNRPYSVPNTPAMPPSMPQEPSNN